MADKDKEPEEVEMLATKDKVKEEVEKTLVGIRTSETLLNIQSASVH